MNISMVGIVIGVAVMMMWGLLCLYGRRCERRLRRWQARWDEFSSRQSSLDVELDRAWRRLKR